MIYGERLDHSENGRSGHGVPNGSKRRTAAENSSASPPQINPKATSAHHKADISESDFHSTSGSCVVKAEVDKNFQAECRGLITALDDVETERPVSRKQTVGNSRDSLLNSQVLPVQKP